MTDTTGHVYNDFKNIPLKVGANILSIKSSIVDEDGQEISIFYRLNVHRRQADEVYYNELTVDNIIILLKMAGLTILMV